MNRDAGNRGEAARAQKNQNLTKPQSPVNGESARIVYPIGVSAYAGPPSFHCGPPGAVGDPVPRCGLRAGLV